MGLIVSVYRNAVGYDCTNGGISSRFTELCIMNIEGPFDPNEKRFPALLVPNVCKTVKIVPAHQDAKGNWIENKSPMFGGNFASTSDSRFHQHIEKMLGHTFYGAVPIHDRFE